MTVKAKYVWLISFREGSVALAMKDLLEFVFQKCHLPNQTKVLSNYFFYNILLILIVQGTFSLLNIKISPIRHRPPKLGLDVLTLPQISGADKGHIWL